MSKFKLLLSVIAMMLLGSTAIMAQESKGYALFGAVPEGYEDLTSKVTIEAVGSATFVDGVFTGAGLPGRICESGNYLKMSFTEAQALTLTEDFEVHVVLAKKEAATGDVQVAFCNNGWSAARLGYIIPNASINTTDTDIALAYADRVTTDWNSYGETSFIGAPANFPAAEIFRLCAAAGEQFEITQIYIEAPHTLPPTVIPDQAPQRIYLRKGTAVTPADVAETANYTATTSVSSAWNLCEASDTFFGITTLVREWWFNFQLKSSADVDLTPVYSTWNLVFRVKNGVVNEGQDRGLTVQVNGQSMSTVTTYADANSFVTYVLPLKDVIFGTNNLGNIATGGTIIDFSSGFDNNAGQTIEFDYIYLTNEVEPIPANVTASANAIAWNKVELSLYAECTTSTKVTYDVTYNGTTKTFIGNAGATTTCVIDGLEGSTPYTFSVVAKNSAGEAAPVTANATTFEKPIPTDVEAIVKTTEWNKVTLGLSAKCTESEKITYTITVKKGDESVKEVTCEGNPEEVVDCIIDGLQGLTTYTFSIVAKNSVGEAAPMTATANTPAKPVGMETRYYFFSSRETLPAGEKLLSVDLRDGKGSTIKWNNAMKGVDPAITTYSAIAVSNGWFSFDQKLKAVTDMSAIADGGYLVIKMRSNLDVTKGLNVRLCNNVSYVLDADDIAYFNNTWNTIVFNLADAQNHPVFNETMGIENAIFQFHSNGMGEGKIDIDYAYLTNDATNVDEGTALEPEGPPTNVDVEVVAEDYYSVTLKLYAECERSTIVTYDITAKTGETIVKTVSCTGNPSEWTNFTVADIPASTEYTFSVVAKNQEGFEATAKTVTAATKTMEQDAKGTRYYIVGEGDASNPKHIAVACKTECYENLGEDTRVSDYFSVKDRNGAWMYVQFKPIEDVPNTINTIDTDNWHIVMRIRSSMDNNVFGWNRFRVNLIQDLENFYLNTSDWWGVTSLGDGQWHTVKFKLSKAAGTVPAQFLQKDQVAVQLRANSNLQPDDFFDIDYLYFTNEVVEDNGTQDGYKILLRDTKDNTALLNTYNNQTVDVDLNRSFVADGAWYTLCLPFSMTADQVNAAFGACKLAKLNGSELRGSSLIHLNFDYVNTIEAGVPYLFMPMADVKPVIIEDVVIDNTLRPIVTDYFSMKGIFYPTHVATGDYFLATDNYLYPVQESDNSSLKGLRAYFTIEEGAPANAQARVVMAPTVATDLQENTITTTAEKVIKDGTIYILRGDKIYTTTGQLVK